MSTMLSQDCHGCGHPALAVEATTAINRWMTEIVAITPAGAMLSGPYDGYGALGYDRDALGAVIVGTCTIWHRACWEHAGSPPEYRGASKVSVDQGWFFEPGTHDLPEPTKAITSTSAQEGC